MMARRSPISGAHHVGATRAGQRRNSAFLRKAQGFLKQRRNPIYSDGEEDSYTYDLLGTLESATNGAGTLRFERDEARRISAERFDDAPIVGPR